MPSQSLLPDAIARARSARKVSQERLAALLTERGLKVSQRSIAGYEKGQNLPSDFKQRALLKLLDEIAGSAPLPPPHETAAEFGPRTLARKQTTGRAADEDTFELVIFDDVTASCGPGALAETTGDDEALRFLVSREFFRALLGIDPPHEMRGIRVKGDSMEPDIKDGQWVLYVPVQQIASGKRHLFQIEDLRTSDYRLHLKRLQEYVGGGVKIISDNRGIGIDDEDLVPVQDALVHRLTGARVRLHLTGRVLWPKEGDDTGETRIISNMIERLASMGLIHT